MTTPHHLAQVRLLTLVLTLGLLVGLLPPTSADAAPGAQRCNIPTDAAFSLVAGANLGCATGAAFKSGASEQEFENGQMLWLEEWVMIVVMVRGAPYDAYDDLFYPGDPESADLTPPADGLLEPRQGFGEVWRKIGGPDAAIGWAVGPEQSYASTVQYFEKGAAIQRADGTVFILEMENHARGTWALAGGI